MKQRITSLLSGSDLKVRAIRGSALTLFSIGGASVLRLVSNLVLARLLAPEMFGIMSLAVVFLAGLELMSDLGTKASVIRSERGDDADYLQTAWTIQVIRGACIFVIACLLSWPAALIYQQPILFPLLCVLSLTALIGGAASISVSTHSRKIELAKLTVVNLVSQSISLVITIAFAWMLESVWALAIGAVLGRAINVILGHMVLHPFKHKLRIEPEALKEMLSFGRWILLGTFLTFLAGRGLHAIQGILVPIETLGLLSIAGILAWFPGILVSKLLGNVAFPAFSITLRNNPEDLTKIVKKVRLALVSIALPIFLLLSFLAQGLVDFLYDSRYSQAGEFLGIMALNGMLGVLPMPYQNLMLATGDSRVHAYIMSISAALRISGLLIGFQLGGIMGMLAGVGAGTFVVFWLSLRFAWKRGYVGLALDCGVLTVLGASYFYILFYS